MPLQVPEKVLISQLEDTVTWNVLILKRDGKETKKERSVSAVSRLEGSLLKEWLDHGNSG